MATDNWPLTTDNWPLTTEKGLEPVIRLIVADDHDIVRAGLCRLLETENGMQVIGDTGSGREAVRLCHKLKPDVLLLDLDMPDIDGLEVTHQIASSEPDVRVLVLTMYGHEEYAVRVLQAGGTGFAVKGISQKELPAAIRKVAEGKKYISPLLMEKTFMRQQQFNKENPLALLSEREFQVFTKLAQGKTLKDISSELCLSDSSVRTYKKRIMEKLNLGSLSDLIRFAIRNNLIGKF